MFRLLSLKVPISVLRETAAEIFETPVAAVTSQRRKPERGAILCAFVFLNINIFPLNYKFRGHGMYVIKIFFLVILLFFFLEVQSLIFHLQKKKLSLREYGFKTSTSF